MLCKLLWLATSKFSWMSMIVIHYHVFILAFLEHLMEDFWVVYSVVVLNSCKLSGCLSVSCHVVESLLFACFAMIFSMRSGWRAILIENLMLMDDLVMIMVIHVHFSWMTIALVILPLLMMPWLVFTWGWFRFLFRLRFFFNHH